MYEKFRKIILIAKMEELNFIKYKYIITYFECNADILNEVWNNME